ncbi:hypothetical protein GCM10028808_41490 [Spirosoma migulaei]
MKSFYFVLTLILLSVGWALAQTGSASSSKPVSTTASPNRQQELYDQYHGITKKPSTASTTAAPVPPTSTVNRVDEQQLMKKSAKTKKVDPPVAITPSEPTATVNRPERAAPAGSASGVRIGIRGGVTYPVFTETMTSVDPAIGFVGGLTFNFGARHVSFQPEVNYARYTNKVTNFGTYTNAIDALEVPLFLKFSTGTYAGSRFFVNVGPYATYALSASQDGKKISLDGTKGRFGFGAGAGLGAALKAGPGHVTIEVRGLYQLGDIDGGFNTDSKIIFGQGTLGYVFPLGGRY